LIRTVKFSYSISCLDISPNCNLIAFGGSEKDFGILALWNVQKKQKLVKQVRIPNHKINSVSFSPDSQTLASGSGEWGRGGEIKLWNINTFAVTKTLSGQNK